MVFEIRSSFTFDTPHSPVKTQRSIVIMKHYFIWSSAALVCLLAVFTPTECRTLTKRDANPSIDPHGHSSHEINDDQYRDKRKVEVVVGVKNAILGFVFDRQRRSPKSALYGFAWEQTTTHKGPTTTEDIVLFTPGKPVSLDVPGELIGSSFSLVTNLSTTVGDYAVNSAIRLQRLLESMRPFLRFLFGAKGIVIEGPTDKPIFSDPNEVKENNLR